MHRGAGDDQITHTGQTGEGFLSGTQRNAKAGDLCQAAGHEHGLSVVAVTHAIGNAGTQGNDILQRGTEFGTYSVGTGVYPKGIRHKGILHELGKGLVAAGGQQSRGDIDGNFLRVAGAGEDYHLFAGLLRHHFAHAKLGALLQSFGHRNEHDVGIQVRGNAAADAAQGSGGAGDDYQLTSGSTGIVPGDSQPIGQHRPGKPGVDPGGFHLRD